MARPDNDGLVGMDGVVVSRMVEPGEVISAGAAVIMVVNLEQVYLRGYIPEGDVGHVRVGQPAQVFLDSDPEQPLQAQVLAIDTEASFTPENVYFRDDRVTQVFGLRLGIENPDGFAKPGMPADGKILLEKIEKILISFGQGFSVLFHGICRSCGRSQHAVAAPAC